MANPTFHRLSATVVTQLPFRHLVGAVKYFAAVHVNRKLPHAEKFSTPRNEDSLRLVTTLCAAAYKEDKQ